VSVFRLRPETHSRARGLSEARRHSQSVSRSRKNPGLIASRFRRTHLGSRAAVETSRHFAPWRVRRAKRSDFCGMNVGLRSANSSATIAFRLGAIAGTLSNELRFEFRHGGDDVHLQSAGRCGSVPVVGQRDEDHTVGLDASALCGRVLAHVEKISITPWLFPSSTL
jgi:hypothetical protein